LRLQIMESYTDTEDKEVKSKTLNLITHVQVEKAITGFSANHSGFSRVSLRVSRDYRPNVHSYPFTAAVPHPLMR
jgi:hypothetical protein